MKMTKMSKNKSTNLSIDHKKKRKTETSCENHKISSERIIINFRIFPPQRQEKKTSEIFFRFHFHSPPAMENCKTFIVRHAYKYAHYHSYICRDINVSYSFCFLLTPNINVNKKKSSPQRISTRFLLHFSIFLSTFCCKRRKFMHETLEGVHDDDCDIKIKINSISSFSASFKKETSQEG
jgi:hypothetical protein